MGDRNAKVGVDNTIMKLGIGKINNNGQRLVDFCTEDNLLVEGMLVFSPKLPQNTMDIP